jgi:phosphomannomutase/phosphoglucomutase
LQPEHSGKLFGTSGIRGPASNFLDSAFAEKIGHTFASYVGVDGEVLVARDVRVHSEKIQRVLVVALLSGGVDVIDCGVAPTPALLFALKETKASAGVVVSGSHTPAEMAGLLFFLNDTGEMDPRGEASFETLYFSEPWRQSSPPKKGALQSVEVIEPYLSEIAEHVGRIGGYRVVVDPGNGATCATLPKALEMFGCSVTTINGEPDGRFPSRPPNPQPTTLTKLSQTVREMKADLGVATDSDGDRAIFATSDGSVLWGDLTGALFARYELERHGGGTIITTINTSNMIKVLCKDNRGQLIVTRVGPPAIAEALRTNEHVIFATEESGKYIWPDIIRYGDAALASGKLLQIMKGNGMGLDELLGSLPKFHQLKSTLECSDRTKADAMRFIISSWKGNKHGRSSTMDGLKVEYPDLSWFLIRASGTEPLLRCSAEGKSMNEARALLTTATDLAREGIHKAKQAVSD